MKRFIHCILISLVIYCGIFLILPKYNYESNSNITSIEEYQNKPKSSFNLYWKNEIEQLGENSIQDIIFDGNDHFYSTGYDFNYTSNSLDLSICKLDLDGNIIWKRLFGGEEDDKGYGITLDGLGNIYTCGQTESFGCNSISGYLVKISINGEFIWNATFDESSFDSLKDIKINSSNSILCAGISKKNEINGDFLLLSLNSDGKIIKNTTYGSSGTDEAYSLAINSQKNVFLVGRTTGWAANFESGIIIKFNKTLDFQRLALWEGFYANDFKDLLIDNDDGIYIAGNTQNWGAGGYDISILRYNSTLDKKWNYTWGGSENDRTFSILKDSKDNFILSGTTKSFGNTEGDAVVVRFNSTGTPLAYKRYGDDSGEEIFYSSELCSNDFLVSVGRASNSDYDALIVSITPFPDDFSLSSPNAGSPDSDGAFTLSWPSTDDCDNYTLYHSNSEILKISSDLEILMEKENILSHEISAYSEGKHYFLVEAHNQYGNTSSNCLEITVQYLPSAFELDINYENSTKGEIYLNWSNSLRSDYYNVFYSNTEFSHPSDGTKILSNHTFHCHLVSELDDGNHFFLVTANNEAGYCKSNIVNATIKRAPFPFELFLNETDSDGDGKFTLTWSKSIHAKVYDIYFTENKTITQVNNSIGIIERGVTFDFNRPYYSYNLHMSDNGIYYFKVLARNDLGKYLSNCVKITVSNIPNTWEGNPIYKPELLWGYLVGGLILIILPLILYFRTELVGKLRNYSEKIPYQMRLFWNDKIVKKWRKWRKKRKPTPMRRLMD